MGTTDSQVPGEDLTLSKGFGAREDGCAGTPTPSWGSQPSNSCCGAGEALAESKGHGKGCLEGSRDNRLSSCPSHPIQSAVLDPSPAPPGGPRETQTAGPAPPPWTPRLRIHPLTHSMSHCGFYRMKGKYFFFKFTCVTFQTATKLGCKHALGGLDLTTSLQGRSGVSTVWGAASQSRQQGFVN